ncbi:hypothetical protein [Arhodomonas sp. SL1]|uniref:hypothetical protein n=1 Tax=Arhodomonas sp. SL1 TaxID=3425691 RepID=UPI003F884285
MPDSHVSIAPRDLTIHASVPDDVTAHAQELALTLALPRQLTQRGATLLAQAVPIYVVAPASRTEGTEVVGGLLSYHVLLAVAPHWAVPMVQLPSSQARSCAEAEQYRLLALASLFSLNPSKDFTPLRRLWSDASRHQLSVVYENLNTVTALGNYLGVPASRYRKQPAPPYSALRQRVKGDVSRYTAPDEGTGSDSDG